MKKNIQKINNLFWWQMLALVLSVAVLPVVLFDYATWLKFLILGVLLVADIFVLYHYYKRFNKLKKELENQLKAIEDQNRKTAIIDIYGILGIPPQYKNDGTLKDIFELLGITPQYDKDGVRLLTIYEILGINPLFTPDGREIPFVFRIKNRINALVRASSASVPLFFVPRSVVLSGRRPYPLDPLMPIIGEPKLQEKKPPIAVNKLAPKIKAPSKPKAPNYGQVVLGYKQKNAKKEKDKTKSKAVPSVNVKVSKVKADKFGGGKTVFPTQKQSVGADSIGSEKPTTNNSLQHNEEKKVVKPIVIPEHNQQQNNLDLDEVAEFTSYEVNENNNLEVLTDANTHASSVNSGGKPSSYTEDKKRNKNGEMITDRNRVNSQENFTYE